MAFYEVEVVAQVKEIYWVEANSEDDAMSNWHEGDLLSQEVFSPEAMAAVLDFDQDNEEPADDGYEVDPLHVVEYD